MWDTGDDHIFVNAIFERELAVLLELLISKTLNVTMLLTVSELPARTADDYDYDDEVLWTPSIASGGARRFCLDGP